MGELLLGSFEGGVPRLRIAVGASSFDATNLVELVQQKLGMLLPPAREIGRGISTELHEFLQQALRVNPGQRPSSVAPSSSGQARATRFLGTFWAPRPRM